MPNSEPDAQQILIANLDELKGRLYARRPGTRVRSS